MRAIEGLIMAVTLLFQVLIIVDWIDVRKPNKKIQTDLDVGCWVSLFLRIERFSSTYLFAQPNLRTTD